MNLFPWRKLLLASMIAGALTACTNAPDPEESPTGSVDSGETDGGGGSGTVTPGPSVVIDSPSANLETTTVPGQFAVHFVNGTPSTVTYKLNGRNVTDLFTSTASGAAADGDALADYLVEGRNLFTAGTKTVAFIYDTQAPRVVVTGVEVVGGDGAAQPTAGDTLQVTGRFSDDTAVTSATLAGTPVDIIGGGHFTAQVPYTSGIYTFATTDRLGNSGTHQIAAPGFYFEPTLGVQLNDSFFDFLLPMLNGALSDFDGEGIVGTETALAVMPILGVDFEVFITELSLDGTPNVGVRVLPNGAGVNDRVTLSAGADLPNVALGIMMRGDLLGQSLEISMNLGVDHPIANILITMLADESNHLQLELPDNAVTLSNEDITQSNVVVCLGEDCSPNPFIAGIVNLALSTMTEGTFFSTQINKLLTNTLRPIVEAVDIANNPANFLFEFDADEEADLDFTIRYEPHTLTADAEGNGYFELSGGIASNRFYEGFPTALGSYYKAGALPDFASTNSQGKEYDLAVALPVNMLNQAFLVMMQGGAIGDFFVHVPRSALGDMGEMLGRIGIGADDILKMTMGVESVPYMTLSHDGSDTGIHMYIDNMNLDFILDRADAEPLVVISLALDVVANIEMGLTDQNTLDFGVDKLLSIKLVDIDSDIPLINMIRPEWINNVLSGALNSILAKTFEDNIDLGRILVTMTNVSGMLADMLDGMEIGADQPAMGAIIRDLGADATDANLMFTIDLLSAAEIAESGEPLTVPIFITVAEDVVQAQNLSPMANGLLRGVASSGKLTAQAESMAVIGRSGTIALNSLNPNPEAGALEHRYRIDNGNWSVWKPRDSIFVYGLDQGMHTVEVCSRTALLRANAACESMPFQVSF